MTYPEGAVVISGNVLVHTLHNWPLRRDGIIFASREECFYLLTNPALAFLLRPDKKISDRCRIFSHQVALRPDGSLPTKVWLVGKVIEKLSSSNQQEQDEYWPGLKRFLIITQGIYCCEKNIPGDRDCLVIEEIDLLKRAPTQDDLPR